MWYTERKCKRWGEKGFEISKKISEGGERVRSGMDLEACCSTIDHGEKSAHSGVRICMLVM